MKNLSAALADHLAAECTTLAYLVKLTRTDGVVRAYTNHDNDLVVDGVTYKADGAFNPTALVSSSALSSDNLALNGMVSAADLSADDLAAGRYDQACCDLYLCNWADLTQGVLQLRRGWLGTVKLQGGQYSAMLLGLHDRLQHGFGDFYTATCRYQLGDSGCTVALAPYTVTGSVTAATGTTQFTDSANGAPAGWFDGGQIVWLSGALAGLTAEVQQWAGGQFTLWLPLSAVPAIGDNYRAVAGCDKRLSSCRDKFNNILNFGGFPHLPGVDKILAYPDSKG